MAFERFIGRQSPWQSSWHWRKIWNGLAGLLVVLGLLCGAATYAAMSKIPPLGDNPDTVIWLLNVDFVILLLLVVMVAQRIVAVWSGRRRGIAGSHLHVRLVSTFSALVAGPAVLMTLFSAVFFHYGVQAWFSQNVQTAINESQAVAQAYLGEHKQVIEADVQAMANDLNRQANLLIGNQEALEAIVQTQSRIRNLPEAIVFNVSGRTLARSGLSFVLEFEPVPDYLLSRANLGEVVVLTGGDNEDRLRALVRLSNFPGHFLYVGRLIDPQVLEHLEATEKAVSDYRSLQTRSSDLQITVTIMFLLVGLLLLLAAVWLGLLLAKQLVDPITTLVSTADRVRGGDYTARVGEMGRVQEFDYLAKSFNRMTKQIQQQQDELIGANRQLDRRRHFTETVLAGVSSGVIGVDGDGVVHLANNAAIMLLNSDGESLTGHSLNAVLPEFSNVVEALKANNKSSKSEAQEIEIVNNDGRRQIFMLRVAIEPIGDADYGAILTFEDITALQVAQRKAAWSDVARRIAHEIKNPLTPIQLSAERLQRKYLPQIEEGKDVFEQCTDTIVKHVGDIGRMVDEFSSFARMPAPNLQDEDLFEVVHDAVFLQKQAYPDIQIELKKTGRRKTFKTQLDAQQIRQALTNLLQNAIDSIHEKRLADGDNQGVIDVLVTSNKSEFIVALADSGMGLPQDENPLHLTEPYVTHKAKGTGLGLAIVKKIIEDHGAVMMFGDRESLSALSGWTDRGGANIVLSFPILDRKAAKR